MVKGGITNLVIGIWVDIIKKELNVEGKIIPEEDPSAILGHSTIITMRL